MTKGISIKAFRDHFFLVSFDFYFLRLLASDVQQSPRTVHIITARTPTDTSPSPPTGLESPIRPPFVSPIPLNMSHFHVLWDYGLSTAITRLYPLMSNHRVLSGANGKLQKHEDNLLFPLPKYCSKVSCMKPVRKSAHLCTASFSRVLIPHKTLPKTVYEAFFLFIFQNRILLSA